MKRFNFVGSCFFVPRSLTVFKAFRGKVNPEMLYIFIVMFQKLRRSRKLKIKFILFIIQLALSYFLKSNLFVLSLETLLNNASISKENLFITLKS